MYETFLFPLCHCNNFGFFFYSIPFSSLTTSSSLLSWTNFTDFPFLFCRKVSFLLPLRYVFGLFSNCRLLLIWGSSKLQGNLFHLRCSLSGTSGIPSQAYICTFTNAKSEHDQLLLRIRKFYLSNTLYH